MTLSRNCPIPPKDAGFRIFVRATYLTKYNFAVANHNAVSTVYKSHMLGGCLLLFRSMVVIVLIISMIFAMLTARQAGFIITALICSLCYIILSIYNRYVFNQKRNLLTATRLLPTKVSESNGRDDEWINVSLHSLSATGQLANENEITCVIYTQRYTKTYPSFPKELLLHLVAFFLAVAVGIIKIVL